MSTKLSFREQLERLDATSVDDRVPSFSPTDIRLGLSLPFAQPVALARLLARHGLGLKSAHAVVCKLVDEGTLPVTVHSGDVPGLIVKLEELGLSAEVTEMAAARGP